MDINDFKKRMHQGEPIFGMPGVVNPKYYSLFEKLRALVMQAVHEEYHEDNWYQEHKLDLRIFATITMMNTLIALATKKAKSEEEVLIWQQLKELLES